MARTLKSKKSEEISDIVDVGQGYQAAQTQAESDVHLEDDAGVGGAAIVRMFEFKANIESFKQYQPTKQELFNYHLQGIEAMLWRDGMKLMTAVTPKLTFSKSGMKYRIFVGAEPQKGHILTERPKTLTEIVHGTRTI